MEREAFIEEQWAKAKVRSRLTGFARETKAKRWQSDEWLRREWVRMGMLPLDLRTPDQFNKVTPPWIPDLVNYWFKYVVECDGSVHLRPDVKMRDAAKDRWFRERGFQIFRVSHGDRQGLASIANKIRMIRQTKGPPPACKIYRG